MLVGVLVTVLVVVAAVAIVVVVVAVAVVAMVGVAETLGLEKSDVEAAAEVLGAAGDPGAQEAVGVEDEAVHRGEGGEEAPGGSDGGEVLLEDLGEARAGVGAEERGGVRREGRARGGADVAVVALREPGGVLRVKSEPGGGTLLFGGVRLVGEYGPAL